MVHTVISAERYDHNLYKPAAAGRKFWQILAIISIIGCKKCRFSLLYGS
jgi:hypothetical protein